jgi:hypothetical protein
MEGDVDVIVRNRGIDGTTVKRESRVFHALKAFDGEVTP